MATLYERIYAVVRRIPRGRVATYGQIAALARIPLQARQVGYALHALPAGTNIPWHRVINAQGRISVRTGSDADLIQRALLVREGISFDSTGQTDLDTVRWKPAAERHTRRTRQRSPARERRNSSPTRQAQSRS